MYAITKKEYKWEYVAREYSTLFKRTRTCYLVCDNKMANIGKIIR